MLLLLAQAAGFAADTAYSALRIVGRQQGERALNRVLEVRGRFGNPQPDVWKITFEDTGARGGLREMEVQRGRVIGQRTPVSRSLGAPMNLNQLNLDSEGVFTVVDQEAKKAAVTFDRVDYVLRSGSHGGAPVWQVELFEGRKGRVGQFEIAADSGAILRQDVEPRRREAVVREEDRAYLYDREPSREPGPSHDRRDGDDRYADERDRRGDYVDEAEGPGIFDLFGKINRHFKRRGRQIENFFTGSRDQDEARDYDR